VASGSHGRVEGAAARVLPATLTWVLNYALYQAGWFAGVLGAASGHPWRGTLICAGLLAAHLSLSCRPVDECVLAASVGALGLVVDAAQMHLGTLRFPGGLVLSQVPPPWLVLLWAQFATTLHFSLGWLRGHPVRAVLLGLLGGPAVFAAGAHLGAVTLAAPLWSTFATLAVLWSLAVPAAVHMARRQRARPGAGCYRWPGAPVPAPAERAVQ
jgi:hypothetical protein